MKKILLLVITIVSSLSLIGCGVESNEDQIGTFSISGEGLNVLGKAAQMSFESQQSSKKQTKRFNMEEEIAGINYPFDCVEILNGTKYSVSNLELKELAELIGEGPYTIIIADFRTYVKAHYNKVETLESCVSDTLVTFISETEMFTCLSNSGSWREEYTRFEFSSHKRITGNAVEKTFNGDEFVFIISFYATQTSIVYSMRNDLDNKFWFFSEEKFDSYDFFEIDDSIELEKSYMYEMLDVTPLPEAKPEKEEEETEE